MFLKKAIKNLMVLKKKREIISVPCIVSEKALLKGKVAFISGGSGGIGFSIARTFVRSGCDVIIAGTNSAKMNSLIADLPELEAEHIKCFVLDLNDISNLDEVVVKTCSFYGKIDIFVNAAGIHTLNVDFWGMNVEEYDRIFNINLKAVYFLCQAFGKYMKNHNIKGHILLISSSRGSEPAWSPYGLTKWSVNGLVKGLAQIMLPHGIVVNGIAPGPTATALLGKMENDSIYTTDNRIGRMAVPNEISEYAKLMVSDLGNMVVGETLLISGGRGCFDIR